MDSTRNLHGPDHVSRHTPRGLDAEEQQLVGLLKEQGYDLMAHGGTKLQVLGTGGHAKVYKAVFRDQPVAVKILHPTLSAEGLFERERLAAERLIWFERTHDIELPNLVRYLSFGTVDTYAAPTHFLVMKFIEGCSLCSHFGDLSVGEKDQIAFELCRAVVNLHRLRIVHRDIKPGNVLLSQQKRPILCDLGIALVYDHDGTTLLPETPAHGVPAGEHAGITTNGCMLGTPSYMAPEQVRKEGWIGPWTDVYQLGRLLIELYAGQAVFGERSIDELRAAWEAGYSQLRLDCYPKLLLADTPPLGEVYEGWSTGQSQKGRYPGPLTEILAQTQLHDSEAELRPTAKRLAEFFLGRLRMRMT